MNKNKKTIAIIAAVIALLAIVGIVVAMTMNNNSDANNQSNQTSNNSEASNVDPAKEFSPVALDSLSYVSTTSTTVGGQTIESQTESDGKGTLKTSSTYAGSTTESYITGNTVVTCIDGACSKTVVDANSEESAALVEDANQYKETAMNTGTEACGTGTCQVWKATGPAGEVTYYIDSQNRIAKISMSGTGAVVTYDYKDVSITVPAAE